MKVHIKSEIGRRINHELEVAQQLLESITPAVSIYGGARVKPEDPYYAKTVELARALSQERISVISGGGPGVMEAANKGAQEGKLGTSVGLNIQLPFEQKPNAYQDISIEFVHFAARKVSFCKYSKAFVVMPGGMGTLDELFEVLTLIQTAKMPEIPVILYGREFWEGLLQWMRTVLLDRGLVAERDLSQRIQVVDTTEEVLAIVRPLVADAQAVELASEALERAASS